MQLFKFYEIRVKSWGYPFHIPHQNFTAFKDCPQLMCFPANQDVAKCYERLASDEYIPMMQWYDMIWHTHTFSRPHAQGLLLNIGSFPLLQKSMSSVNTGADVLALFCKMGFAFPRVFRSLFVFRETTGWMSGWALWQLLQQPLLFDKLSQFHGSDRKKKKCFSFELMQRLWG